MFRVGQKVVCVDVRNTALGSRVPLHKNAIYIIDDVDTRPDEFGGLAFRLVGVEGLYYHWRFRPIVERKTDISIFTEMLSPARKHEVANG